MYSRRTTIKEVWSPRYGKNPRKGLNNFLKNKISGYKPNKLFDYLLKFAEHCNYTLGGSNKLIRYTSSNFDAFAKFINSLTNK